MSLVLSAEIIVTRGDYDEFTREVHVTAEVDDLGGHMYAIEILASHYTDGKRGETYLSADEKSRAEEAIEAVAERLKKEAGYAAITG
jgi:hypothetical protein